MPFYAHNVAETLVVPSSRSIREPIITHWARINQFLTWFIIAPLSKVFFELDIQGRQEFGRVRGPFIIIANHVRFYDSFLFRVILGLWTPHMPLRFMAVKRNFHARWMNILARMGVMSVIYSLFGAFIVTPGKGIRANLERARVILEQGGVVVIYPEGKIVRDAAPGQFRNGSAFLAKETGAPIIPVVFRVRCKRLWRRKISIRIGKPISLGRTDGLQSSTKTMQKVVGEMYEF